MPRRQRLADLLGRANWHSKQWWVEALNADEPDSRMSVRVHLMTSTS